jgi:hypothetical protein
MFGGLKYIAADGRKTHLIPSLEAVPHEDLVAIEDARSAVKLVWRHIYPG